MAWKQRGSRFYYYRNKKINGRVITEYLGVGMLAELAAQLDGIERITRETKAKALRKVKAEQDAIDQQIDELGEQVRACIEAELLSRGYRQHKRGEWRKKRDGRATSQSIAGEQ
jgi:hypothetical protein